MNEFNTILGKIKVAYSSDDVRGVSIYQNISASEWLAKLRKCVEGDKKGSHWIRTTLNTDNTGQCLGRSNENASNFASIVVIDCDKRINADGEEIDGAPDPLKVSHILNDLNLAYVLYGSYSHYTNDKGHRYRIQLITSSPYKKEQLAPTIESIISRINLKLIGEGCDLLANAIENSTWSQGWYCPRKPKGSKIETLYFENTEGQLVDVIDPLELPPTTHVFTQKTLPNKPEQISVIQAFNEQRNIEELLSYYGYQQILPHKWLRPNSSSGIPGITVKGNKFYSHHADEFHDGYWHDCFDVWRVMEKLDLKDAIAQAAQTTYLPDGCTVDEFNKSLANNEVLPSNIKFNVYQPFDNKLLPVDDIPYGSLPEQMETFIKEQSEIRGCPPDFILVSVLARMGVLFAGKLKIAMTKHTNWHVTPNFFWMMVGPPSSLYER